MEFLVCSMFSNNTINDLAMEIFLSPLYDKKKEDFFYPMIYVFISFSYIIIPI